MSSEFQGMTKEDIAKIARMGEQISGLSDDVKEIKENQRRDNSEIKQSITNFTSMVEKQTELYVNSIKELTEHHYTKEEIGFIVANQKTAEDTQNKEIAKTQKSVGEHEKRIAKLERRWAWLTGVGALAIILLGVVEAAIRLWKG